MWEMHDGSHRNLPLKPIPEQDSERQHPLFSPSGNVLPISSGHKRREIWGTRLGYSSGRCRKVVLTKSLQTKKRRALPRTSFSNAEGAAINEMAPGDPKTRENLTIGFHS
jgi:hypothetical protein